MENFRKKIFFYKKQRTRVTRTHFIHVYVRRREYSRKWATNSKPYDHEFDALPQH